MRSAREIAEVHELLEGVISGRLPNDLSRADIWQLRQFASVLGWVLRSPTSGDMFPVTIGQLRNELDRVGQKFAEAACAPAEC